MKLGSCRGRIIGRWVCAAGILSTIPVRVTFAQVRESHGTAARATRADSRHARGGTLAGVVRASPSGARHPATPADSGSPRPIAGATILVVDPALEPVTTDARGQFRIDGIPAGPIRVLVTAIGYSPARRSVNVAAGDTIRLDLTLQRTALELAGITVSATASERDPLAVSQPVTALGGRDLERSLGATLTQTLAWTAGVTARSQGPAATMPVIRGLTGERIVVMHDGQRAGDLAGSAPDHGVTVDPLAARDVEVVRGPAALLHGSAALGGVVNVRSDDIARTVPTGRLVGITLQAQGGSDGGGALVDVVQPVAGRWVLRAKGGTRSHDEQPLGRGDPRGTLENTSMRNRSGVLSLTGIGARGLAGIALRGYGFEYGLPWRDVAADGVRLRGGRREAIARAEVGGAGPVTRVRLDAGMQAYAHDEVTAGGGVATALAVRSHQATLLARTRPVGALRDGAIGLSLLARRNDVSGPAALTPPNANRTIALFGFQEVAPLAGRHAPRVPIALRLERATSRSDATEVFGPGVSRAFVTLSTSAGVSVPVATGTSIALNVATAARVPSAEELFSRAGHAGTGAFEIGNPSLAHESSRGLDAVLRVERSSLRAQLAVWTSAIDGWIGMYPTGRDTSVVSPGGGTKRLPLHAIAQRDARLRGAEASVEAAVARRWVVQASADVLRARDAEGEALPFMPPARVGGGVRWDDGRWQAGWTVRRVFAQRRVAPGEIATAAVTLVEGQAGLRLLGGANVHTILVRGDNLADRLYRDATSRIKDFAPAAGRNVSLLYRVTF